MPESLALKLASQGEREIVLSRYFVAPRPAVFAALTTPDLVKRWLLGPPGWTMEICEIDLSVGGAYRYLWRHPNGAEIGLRGVFAEIIPPERLVQTENFDAAWYPGQALITTTLREQGEGAALTAVLAYDSREARDIVLASAMDSGLVASYDRLDALLRSGASVPGR